MCSDLQQEKMFFHAAIHTKKKAIKISYLYVIRLRVLALRLHVGSNRQGKGKEPTWSDASYLLP